MTQGDFRDRLTDYFRKVGEVLKGQASTAAIFPNPTDIGVARERVYAAVLQQHLPPSARVFLGGFLFNDKGDESKQIDIVITASNALQFNFHNQDGGGRSFASVEGCIGAVSVKSNLTTAELRDALANLASIPQQPGVADRTAPRVNLSDYEDWPYKIVYASDGVSVDTCFDALSAFYTENPGIPEHRRVNLIHVAGKYGLMRSGQHRLDKGGGLFGKFTSDPDVTALMIVILEIQRLAQSATHILFDYDDILAEFDERRRRP